MAALLPSARAILSVKAGRVRSGLGLLYFYYGSVELLCFLGRTISRTGFTGAGYSQ